MKNKAHSNIELVTNYEHLNTKYRFKYHEFANLIEWEELVRANFLERLFKSQYKWKRIYFGHITPLEKCLETFNDGHKITSNQLNP